MSSRPRRAKKKVNEEALAALAAARAGKRQRNETYEGAADEDDVFEEVTQREYEALVAQRREMDDFVVDDEGLYVDNGEEDFWDDAGKPKTKKRRTGKSGKKKSKKIEEVKKIDSRFLRGGTTAASASLDTKGEDDAMLDNLLEGFENDDDDNEEEDISGAAAGKLEDMAIFAPQSKIADQEKVEEELDNLEEMAETAKRTRRSRPRKEIPQAEPTEDIENFDEDEMADPLPELEPSNDTIESSAENKAEKEMVTEDIDTKIEDLDSKDDNADAFTGVQIKEEKEKKKDVRNLTADKAFDKVVSNANDLVDDDELKLYYYDAYYERFAADATVYLFGKALLSSEGKRKSVSVCLSVRNLERSIYILPRKYHVSDPNDPSSVTSKEVKFTDVHKEMKGILRKLGVRRWRCKKEEKNYCFEQPYIINQETEDGARSSPSVPPRACYFKLSYSYTYPALPRDLKGQTFEFVFGTGSTSLELLLLERELMGPCWISIKNPKRRSTTELQSWCKYEYEIDNHKLISKLPNPQPPSPPFSLMSLSVKTKLSASSQHEISLVSMRFLPSMSIDSPLPANWKHESQTVSMACKLEGKAWPYDLLRMERRQKTKIIKQVNERALLSYMTNKIYSWDPDIIVAHDLHGFVIDVMINRMQRHKVDHWSRIGRLKKSRYPRGSRGGLSLVDFGIGSGRLMVDTQVSAKELVRENTYTLTHLARTRLGEYRHEIQGGDVEKAYSSGESLLNLVKHTENDGNLTIGLMDRLQVVPLTKQLTTICGNLWSRSLRSARAERVEYLLLHRFHNLDYIVPEKLTSKEKKEKMALKNKELGITDNPGKRRKKPKYSGGLVLEPKKGFYDKYVLLLDFNSLYPSIILEFDLCFTTVKHWEPRKEGEYADLPVRDSTHNGTLPKVIKQLLTRRKVVKQLMKKERNQAKKKVLDIRQKAIKLVANSMYGCLGFSSSRFFCQPIAALITSQGRSILEKTKQLAENSLGMQVIYGDTDSIMIYTDSVDYDQVFKMGKQVKVEVNKLYRELTIDIDGVFKKMLLLKKKKYAALTISKNQDGLLEAHKETKGLDLVRRDWCPISKSTGNFILDRILSDAPREEVVDKILNHLEDVHKKIKEGKIALGRFVITKGLTKHPDAYPDAKSQPHVMVAKRMLAEKKPVRVGAFIPYVICTGNQPVAQRAYHIDEIKRNPKLKVDNKWYFSTQMFPPIARLIAPIKEITAAQVAESLGLKGAKFANYNNDEQQATDELVFTSVASIHDDKERFKDCESLTLPCACGVHKKFSGIIDFESGKSGLSCPTRGCKGIESPKGRVKAFNAITVAARKHISEYYESWFECKNQVCGRITRSLPMGSAKCTLCYEPLSQKYPDSKLYTQLTYFQSLFDLQRTKKNLEAENKRRKEAGLEDIKLELSAEQEDIVKGIYRFISDRYIKSSAFNYIDLGSLFSSVYGS